MVCLSVLGVVEGQIKGLPLYCLSWSFSRDKAALWKGLHAKNVFSAAPWGKGWTRVPEKGKSEEEMDERIRTLSNYGMFQGQ